ncbi:hypothetical protein A2765_00565 [Candidatus Kaiserbacteria bacterium RIFCSPHIGHO2_01_FULL_56_24]|uniref:D,D-heptose 1,7-bisphosphate phosphatase n=1 Tax=Candidatus Kaiserbacteria bacterium RIFCSPHIGHO2_01_FULL_56_24 TaxID=1798487 RepID=A0A1F6DBN2_9BACT|nr:MAG: hypothetical protein A2765_00565 [Candidatus Kaiserbacteria bacterium RIFCSPHIGHO2_01_FULL_56_24]
MGVNSKEVKLIRQAWGKKNRTARPAVFLDRDGVLIRLRDVASEEKHMRPLAGAARGLERMQEAGFLLILVTNQPIIEKGIISIARAKKLNEYLRKELKKGGVTLDAAYTCPHRFGAKCPCRKPCLGLIEAAQEDFKIDMTRSWLIGDTTRDMETGKRAKLKTVLVKTGDRGKDRRFFKTEGNFKAQDLVGVAQVIIEQKD